MDFVFFAHVINRAFVKTRMLSDREKQDITTMAYLENLQKTIDLTIEELLKFAYEIEAELAMKIDMNHIYGYI